MMLKFCNLALSSSSLESSLHPLLCPLANRKPSFSSDRLNHSILVSLPRVRAGSGCNEAIYFWHPFLLRLVHPFIICICFCRPVPVGPVFVGPLGAHVSIFLVPATPPPPLDSQQTRSLCNGNGGRCRFATHAWILLLLSMRIENESRK